MVSSCGPSHGWVWNIKGCFWPHVTESLLGLTASSARLATCLVTFTSLDALSFHAQFQFHPNRTDSFYPHQRAPMVVAVSALRSLLMARWGTTGFPQQWKRKFLFILIRPIALGLCLATPSPFTCPVECLVLR